MHLTIKKYMTEEEAKAVIRQYKERTGTESFTMDVDSLGTDWFSISLADSFESKEEAEHFKQALLTLMNNA